MNRNVIGIEILPEYYNLAKESINQLNYQLPLLELLSHESN